MKGNNPYNPLKSVHDLARVRDMREGKIVAPKTIRIDLTTYCNHGCPFCLYQSSSEGLKGVGLNSEMPLRAHIDEKRLIQLMGEFVSSGVQSVVFLGGGEPTYHPHFKRIVEGVSQTSLEWGIVTNGSKTDVLEDFLETPNFKWIRVSLDAADEETWNKNHRPSSGNNFVQIFEMIKRTSKKKGEEFLIGLSYIVNETNYFQIYDFAMLARANGADNVRFGFEYGPEAIEKIAPHRDAIIGQVKRAKKELENEDFKVIDKFVQRFDEIEINERDYSSCGFQNLSTNLGVDMCLYTCCFGKYSPKFRIGSLQKQSFENLWFRERKKFLHEFNVEKCPACWYGEINRILEYMTQERPIHDKFIG